jgi:phosphatidylinositol alpha-1,6-mannosyltransferase
MVLGVFGSLLQCGGIERANRLAAAVLTEMARERGQTAHLLSLNEAPGAHAFALDGHQYSVLGFGRHKLKCTAHALRLAPQVQVAYLAHPNLARLGALLRLTNPKLRYWVATHGVEVWRPLKPLSRLALRGAHGVTAPSRFTLEQLRTRQGLNPSKLALVPHGLEPGFADSGLDRDEPSPSGLILTVARLAEAGKGIDTVIRALPKVLQAVPGASYIVVGEGCQRACLEQLAAQSGVHDRVHLVGRQGEQELKNCYRKADVFVMPSRQEGFGIVFLEAMAFGKPVIGAAFGGIPDIVVDGVTGFLVKYGDVEALAERLICLLRDPDLRARMGLAAQQRVRENYTFGDFRRRLSGLLGT